MPFFMPAKYKIKKDCVSLQVHKSKNFHEKNRISQYCRWKRVCLFTSPVCKTNGSITIEASIALILFMMMGFFIGSFLIIINTELAMQIHINNIARNTAKNMFYINAVSEISDYSKNLQNIKTKIQENFNGEEVQNEIDIEQIFENGMNKAYLMAQIVRNIKPETFNSSYFLCGVQGINIADSRIEEGMVDLIIKYEMKVPFINKYLSIRQRALVKDWTGTDITKTSDRVYITQNGQVYHRSKNCSHLVIHISKSTVEQVGKLRNASGGKYYKCQYCGDENLLPDVSVFITEDGNRYHTSLQCQGLTRKIIEIDISQVGERKPCSECGQGD